MLRWHCPALFALTLPLILLSASADAAERWVGRGSGQLLIDRDGSVAEVTLKKGFGDQVSDAVIARMRQWRFEPIIENGKPVRAEAHMAFELETLIGEDGNAERLSIAEVSFVNPPGVQDPDSRIVSIKHPTYPTRMIRQGLGAEVRTLVEVGADGKPLRMATSAIELYASADRIQNESGASRNFADASQNAIAQWTFAPSKDGQPYRVTVPITYSLNTVWHRSHPVALSPEPWTLSGDIAAVTELGEGGASADARIKLLTELDADTAVGG